MFISISKWYQKTVCFHTYKNLVDNNVSLTGSHTLLYLVKCLGLREYDESNAQ